LLRARVRVGAAVGRGARAPFGVGAGPWIRVALGAIGVRPVIGVRVGVASGGGGGGGVGGGVGVGVGVVMHINADGGSRRRCSARSLATAFSGLVGSCAAMANASLPCVRRAA
jgi:hypothetical protein